MATSTAAGTTTAGKSLGTPAKPHSPRPIRRLLRYVLPYWWQVLASVTLMAMVGLLDAGRVLLIGPIFDRVLNPGSQTKTIQLFRLPGTERFLNLQQLVPSHFQNPWTIVAFALVAATVLKGIFDYAGTYLVNYAGFGMITDLRDDLYNAILRSSAAFFTKHTTGTLLSTMVNDIERVQYAMSGVLAEFLRLRKRSDVFGHLRMPSRQPAKFRHEMRIRQKTYIEHQVSIVGQAVFVSKAHA